MSQIKNQDPLSAQDLQTYLNFLLTQNVESEKHAKQINRLARRTTTLSDVVVLFNQLVQHQEAKISLLIDQVRVQENILRKLGATEEVIAEAREEYQKSVDEYIKKITTQQGEKEDKEGLDE
ncbi:hypothetical protein Goe25_01110 [Bacillus phage vB_BsuM-Goe25]|nr:hypothetical protein Goe25_01110 [Bacillus phage vB_BsuM-Goe25]